MPQIFDLAALNGSNGFTVVNNSTRGISGAGDMNGDGFDNLLVAGTAYSGTSKIFFG